MIGIPKTSGADAGMLAGMAKLHTLCLSFPLGRSSCLDRPGGGLSRIAAAVHSCRESAGAAPGLGPNSRPGLGRLLASQFRHPNEGCTYAAQCSADSRVAGADHQSQSQTSELLNVIAQSPCAAHLRILRLHFVGLPRLANGEFARPAALPRLTSLELSSPFDPDNPEIGNDAEVKDTGRVSSHSRDTELEIPESGQMRVRRCLCGCHGGRSQLANVVRI